MNIQTKQVLFMNKSYKLVARMIYLWLVASSTCMLNEGCLVSVQQNTITQCGLLECYDIGCIGTQGGHVCS
jgi:hypothetical protein